MDHPGVCPSVQPEDVSSDPSGLGDGWGRTGCEAYFAAAGGGCTQALVVPPGHSPVPQDCQWSWSIDGERAGSPSSGGSAAEQAHWEAWTSPSGPTQQSGPLPHVRESGSGEVGGLGGGGGGHYTGLQE